MQDCCLKSLTVGTGPDPRSIAIRERPGTAPGLFWLGGFKSDMLGTKAEALDAWAAQNGRAMVRFDYSGHGESGGDFVDGTIGSWLEDSLAVFDACCHGIGGDVFGTFEVANYKISLVGTGGGECETTVAHDDGGDSMPAGAGAKWIPGDLCIHVGMAVNETGRDDVAVSVEFLASFVGNPADLRDPPALDADIGAKPRHSAAVDHRTVTNDQVVGHDEPPLQDDHRSLLGPWLGGWLQEYRRQIYGRCAVWVISLALAAYP